MLPTWVGLLCHHSDWIHIYSLSNSWRDSGAREGSPLSITHFLPLMQWLTCFLLPRKSLSGEETKRGISEAKSPICCGVLWPRGRSEVSSCFDLSWLGMQGLAASSCSFLPADNTTTEPATWETVFLAVPCSGLWAYAGHLTCYLAMTSITEPPSLGSSQLQGTVALASLPC